jgi:hypothetical protein
LAQPHPVPSNNSNSRGLDKPIRPKELPALANCTKIRFAALTSLNPLRSAASFLEKPFITALTLAAKSTLFETNQTQNSV